MMKNSKVTNPDIDKFSPSNVTPWLESFELTMKECGITKEHSKYEKMIENLDIDILSKLPDEVLWFTSNNSDCYRVLRGALIHVFESDGVFERMMSGEVPGETLKERNEWMESSLEKMNKPLEELKIAVILRSLPIYDRLRMTERKFNTSAELVEAMNEGIVEK
ncbi:unnamed protein product [Lepeophtheirus salmonis]|uniref:(salmon louse) hypothetical protein n=1 Tax=Lepeophtheirus salmonis TaxID=72036 RepID=A0A7R8CMC5_LEPSM|nr:unnamed protein product [Lepeophtheirus salmonis]CAF2864313.1 unnamed protein product [Lepeophtheirus salmonis]